MSVFLNRHLSTLLRRGVQCSFFAIAGVLVSVVPAQAEIFTWTDAQGRVHFGDRPPQEAGLEVEKMATPEPVNTMSVVPGNPLAAPGDERAQAVRPQKDRSGYAEKRWGGAGPDTNDKRCALAQDILAGRAIHGNGLPTDAYDIRVAKRDVKKFCP